MLCFVLTMHMLADVFEGIICSVVLAFKTGACQGFRVLEPPDVFRSAGDECYLWILIFSILVLGKLVNTLPCQVWIASTL